MIVLPGGGFQILAMDLGSTGVRDWLTSSGIACVLLKYRGPSAVRLAVRLPGGQFPAVGASVAGCPAIGAAGSWACGRMADRPEKIGVLGFSAGGDLVAEISTNFKRRVYSPIADVDMESSRPDFAMAIDPGHLTVDGRIESQCPGDPPDATDIFAGRRR